MGLLENRAHPTLLLISTDIHWFIITFTLKTVILSGFCFIFRHTHRHNLINLGWMHQDHGFYGCEPSDSSLARNGWSERFSIPDSSGWEVYYFDFDEHQNLTAILFMVCWSKPMFLLMNFGRISANDLPYLENYRALRVSCIASHFRLWFADWTLDTLADGQTPCIWLKNEPSEVAQADWFTNWHLVIFVWNPNLMSGKGLSDATHG